MKALLATVMLLTICSLAIAGEPPPRGGGGGGEGGPGAPGGGPPPRMPGGPGMGRGMPGPGGHMEAIETLRGYLGIVDAFSRMTRDPSQAGIAAVIGAGDILKPRGADAGIQYFTKLLPEVKNPAVQRAIRVQLAELYKQAGKQDQALEQLRELMVSAPAGSEESPPPPPQRTP